MEKDQDLENDLRFRTTQENGCRTRQASHWDGPEPAKSSELFVKNIPREMMDEDLWPLFERFGQVFQLRLLMDYNGMNRGFCFVVFATETEATVCMEILNHYFLTPGHCLHIQKSIDKSRLFVSNLPRNVAKRLIREKFQELFPEMSNFVVPKPVDEDEPVEGLSNRGFGFMDFETHADAVKAKKRVYTGILKIWGQQIHINWAKPEYQHEDDDIAENKTIFIKNINPELKRKDVMRFLCQYIEFEKIEKFCLKFRFGVIKAATREDAEALFEQLQGKVLKGIELKIEWCRGAKDNKCRTNNFVKALCLKSVANFWSKPIMVFGRFFPNDSQQYTACFITFGVHTCAIFFKIRLQDDLNVPSRMAEAIVSLIEDVGYLPNYNYVLDIGPQTNSVVGYIQDLQSANFVRTHRDKSCEYFFYWTEMMELSLAVHRLVHTDRSLLDKNFQDAKNHPVTGSNGHEFFVLDGISTNNRMFTCIYNDQDDIVMLLLCDKSTVSNCHFVNDAVIRYSVFKSPMCHGKHPQNFAMTAAI